MHIWRFHLAAADIIVAEGCLFYHGGVAVTTYNAQPNDHGILTFRSLEDLMAQQGPDLSLRWIDVPTRWSREIGWIRAAGLPDPPEEG